MLKIPKKASIIISIVLTVLFFICCVCVAVLLPAIVYWICQGIQKFIILSDEKILLFEILSYATVTLAGIAAIMLFLLLMRVYRGNVFTEKSVALIRYISWCCFAIAAVLLGMSYFLIIIGFVLAFVAILLGLCLRVVKNVIEEATEIKAENDLTV